MHRFPQYPIEKSCQPDPDYIKEVGPEKHGLHSESHRQASSLSQLLAFLGRCGFRMDRNPLFATRAEQADHGTTVPYPHGVWF